MFWTVSSLPMERLGLVVHGLLRIQVRLGVERGGAETTAGLYMYCCKKFHFISFHTTPRLAASPLPSVLSSKKAPRARASPLTRSSETPRTMILLWTPPHHSTLSTLHCPTLNPLLQPPVRLDSGRTPSATGTLWPTCLNTHRRLSQRVATMTRAKPKRTSSCKSRARPDH
jgi:hypothetical protein